MQAKENPARTTLGNQNIGDMLRASILAHHGVSVTVPATSKYIRFDDKGREGGGPLWAFNDGFTGVWGDWRTGESHVMSNDEGMTPQQIAEARRKADEAKRQYEHDRREKQAQTAAQCRAEWPTLLPASADHPYLVAKGVKPHYLRQSVGALVVPLSDGERLVNFQTILPDGFKRFRRGGKITGCYSPLGEIQANKPLLICEGWATGASLHEVSGVAVACAMNAGNLLPVCESFRRRYPNQPIVIASDNDHEKPINMGLTKAQEAARFIGAGLIHPPSEKGVSDFNDYLLAGGSVEL